MYITHNSISCLKAFLDGWYFRAPNTVGDAEIMGEFQDWVALKFGIKSTQSWASILLFYSTDEYSALQKFFTEFDLFLSERVK